MKRLLLKLTLCIAVTGMVQTVSAQSFLKKLSKTAESLTTEQKSDTETSATDTVSNKIKESDLPVYSIQKVYETDEQGNRLKAEDGTDKWRAFLVDKKGNKVSAESVVAQSKQINDAIIKIAAKVGVGAGIGALTGKGKGALIGVAAGLGLSVPDIILVIKLKKNAIKQKKALDVYRQSFDDEGNPIAAKLDKETIKALDISEENSTSETTAKIKEDIKNMGDVTSNESIDALLAAATKV